MSELLTNVEYDTKIQFFEDQAISTRDMNSMLQYADIEKTGDLDPEIKDEDGMGNYKVPSLNWVKNALLKKVDKTGEKGFDYLFAEGINGIEKSYFLEKTYPVGSVYMTIDENFNPEEVFSGRWIKKSGFEDKGVYMWERVSSCSVTFELKGGSPLYEKIYLESGSKLNANDYKPTKRGYTFGGWYKDATFQDDWDFTNDTVTRDVTLYAKWDIEEYDIYYHEGSAEGNPSKYTIETEFKLVAPKKEHCKFLGWRVGSPTGQKIDNISNGLTGKLDLYATWKTLSLNSKICYYCGSDNVYSHGEVTSSTGTLYECFDCHKTWRI